MSKEVPELHRYLFTTEDLLFNSHGETEHYLDEECHNAYLAEVCTALKGEPEFVDLYLKKLRESCERMHEARGNGNEQNWIHCYDRMIHSECKIINEMLDLILMRDKPEETLEVAKAQARFADNRTFQLRRFIMAIKPDVLTENPKEKHLKERMERYERAYNEVDATKWRAYHVYSFLHKKEES